MKIIKKYTAIQLYTQIVDDNVRVRLSYGNIEGPYYSRTSPEEEFETEEEAIAYAYNFDKWARWLIVPVVSFDTWEKE